MEFIDASCPICGAVVRTEKERKQVICGRCGNVFPLSLTPADEEKEFFDPDLIPDPREAEASEKERLEREIALSLKNSFLNEDEASHRQQSLKEYVKKYPDCAFGYKACLIDSQYQLQHFSNAVEIHTDILKTQSELDQKQFKLNQYKNDILSWMDRLAQLENDQEKLKKYQDLVNETIQTIQNQTGFIQTKLTLLEKAEKNNKEIINSKENTSFLEHQTVYQPNHRMGGFHKAEILVPIISFAGAILFFVMAIIYLKYDVLTVIFTIASLIYFVITIASLILYFTRRRRYNQQITEIKRTVYSSEELEEQNSRILNLIASNITSSQELELEQNQEK